MTRRRRISEAKLAFFEDGVPRIRNFSHVVHIDRYGQMGRPRRARGLYFLATGTKDRLLAMFDPEETRWPVEGVSWHRAAFWFLIGIWVATILDYYSGLSCE